MLTVWGREGKPVSLKMWVVLTAKRLRCWSCDYCLSSLSNQNRLINPTRLTAVGKKDNPKTNSFPYFPAGGGIQDWAWRQAVCPRYPVWEKNGLCCCGEPQQSQGHGHPATCQVWGECPCPAHRTQKTGMEEVTWFILWYYSCGEGGKRFSVRGRWGNGGEMLRLCRCSSYFLHTHCGLFLFTMNICRFHIVRQGL